MTLIQTRPVHLEPEGFQVACGVHDMVVVIRDADSRLVAHDSSQHRAAVAPCIINVIAGVV